MKNYSVDDLKKIRARLPEFKTKEREIRDAPGVISNAEALIPTIMEVEDRIDVSPMLRGKEPTLPTITYVGPDHERITIPNFWAALKQIIPQQVEAFLKAETKLAADLAGPGIDEEERMKRTLAIKRDRLSAEITEEKIILALRDQGVEVDRRADMDPRALIFEIIEEAQKLPEITDRWKFFS
jgi:hypothetical protein